MLSQADIDALKYRLDDPENKEPVCLYYVAHMIEGRETNTLDEHTYKSVSDFKVVKIEIEDIQNAYFEYLNYINNPDNYHIEEEECYYRPDSVYMHYFTVPNTQGPYDKDINARMPAIIYGYTRKVGENTVNDSTPIKPIYVHYPEYSTMTREEAINAIDDGRLNWKYMKLNPKAELDGIEYEYLTSDWYILTLKNYPMVEKPLIVANECSGYFVDIQDAFNYLEQLKA